MPKLVYIGYFTKDTPYQVECQYLIGTLEQFKLPYVIYMIENQGNWQKNTQFKAKIIQNALYKLQCPIVYVDCDAKIQQDPILFNELVEKGIDFAYHMKDGKELLSGTMFMNYSNVILRLITTWIEQIKVDKDIWEQKVLQKILPQFPELKIYNLPPTYCQIFDNMKHCGSPVIEHFQASRRFKSAVDTRLK